MTSPTIYQLPTPLAGSVGILPQQKYMVVGDNLATITTAGYLNSINLESYTVSTNDILNVLYSYNPVTQVGTFEQFSISISGGTITLVALSNAGEVTLPTIANHIATYTNVSGHLSEDPATAISGGNIQAGLSGTAGTLASFPTTAARGSLVVKAVANTGDTLTTISNAAMGQASVVSIPDPGAATANFLISASAAGQSIASTTASPTPGTIRAVTGVMTGSAGTMTTGNLVGLRGEVDVVSASGGFLYGTQGKIIPTGTLSGSVWAAGLFGQLNVSAATINAGQVATVWGDWGATGATATNMTGARGIYKYHI